MTVIPFPTPTGGDDHEEDYSDLLPHLDDIAQAINEFDSNVGTD